MSKGYHTAVSASDSTISSPSIQPSEAEEAVMDDLESSPILHHSYFPFTRLPGRFASIDANSSFPLCRVGYGGQVREGNNAADARAAVKSYLRLGGNFVDLTRHFSLDMIGAFKELIQENKILGDVVIGGSISSQDLLSFISEEKDRFYFQPRNRGESEGADSQSTTQFESKLFDDEASIPTTPKELLPHIRRILPIYMEYFLRTHEIASIDVLMFEPPMINLHPQQVPNAAYDYIGGVSDDFNTSTAFSHLLTEWFTALEAEVSSGRIKSFGLNSARLSFQPTGRHTSEWAFPIENVIKIAQQVGKKVNMTDQSPASNSSHHLSTLKFPFSLFNAYHLLYPIDASRTPSSSSSSSSFVSPLAFARSEGILLLGDSPFDDSEPNWSEWIRFQQVEPTIAVQHSNKVLPAYRDAMGKLTAMELKYKSMIESLPVTDKIRLPDRIPHASWAHLLHTHQNEVYNWTSWETLHHLRIKPSLRVWNALKFDSNPDIADFAKQYSKELPPLCHAFQQALEYTSTMRNEKLNSLLLELCQDKFQHFPLLEHKTILILLSAHDGVDTLLTDQMECFHTFALQLVKLYNLHDEKEIFHQPSNLSFDSPKSTVAACRPTDPTITTVLRHYLLTPSQLETVLKGLQTRVAAILFEGVMKDPLRKKKPLVAV